MNTRFACGLITLLGVLALQPAAHATFHLMQIEQVIGSVNGDTTAQAIQLRMRAAGQNFVSGGKLVVFDAAGLNPITVLDVASNVANGAVGAHVLIASVNFPSHTMPTAVPDFTMANLIPASYFAAGSLAWESNAGTVFWRLSWGGAAYTGPCTGSTDNDVDGKFSIKRVGCTDSDLTVFYAISGTARNGVDYRRLSGSATIRSGTPKAAITVKPIDDGIPGPDETVILTLSPDPSYTIGSRNSAT